MKATGTNTATTERVTASTASAISEVPFRAASQGVSPCSRCRTMFSITTMASSIRRPIDRVSASIVITLKVNPSALMTAKVPTMAVGSAAAETSVERQLRRKRSTTSTARTPPTIMSSCTEEIDARMNCAPSTTVARRLPAGSWRLDGRERLLDGLGDADGVRARLLRTTSPMALVPPSCAEERASAGPSSTCATCPSRTGTPPGLATTSARSASTERASPASLTDRSTPGSRVRPPGTSIDCARIPWTTSAGERP